MTDTEQKENVPSPAPVADQPKQRKRRKGWDVAESNGKSTALQ